MDFSCPKCKSTLKKSNTSYVCVQGHAFDIARSGYINLLPPSGNSSHGDNREMVMARHDFLNTGHYLPLVNRICALAKKHFKADAHVLDVGCGEGYYTSYIENMLKERDGRSFVSAFDISKEAVKRAARNKNISLAVASAYSIPVKDGAFDAAVNIFSPLAKEEIARILITGGIFLMVFPGEEHLFGLKSRIYDTPYKNTPAELGLEGFKLIESERVLYRMKLDRQEEIRALFMMTPYAYRTSASGRDSVFALNELSTDADFYICVYEKE